MPALRHGGLTALLIVLAACEPQPEDARKAAAQAPAPPSATESWIGRWNGPEGTFLALAPGDSPGRMRLTLKDSLDSQADYIAIVEGDRLRFTRRGATETVRPGTGADTGFKWLLDKRDCLIVTAGKEGYCRD